MKKKLIEKTPIPATKHKGYWTVLQIVEGILVLNLFYDKKLQLRHCFNPDTYEYATWKPEGVWNREKIKSAYNGETTVYYYGCRERSGISQQDKATIANILSDEKQWLPSDPIEAIGLLEEDANREKRIQAEDRRMERVNARMRRVPLEPWDLALWIDKKETGGMDYCLKDRKTKRWSCSACGNEFELNKKYRNHDMITCPKCKKEIKYLTRKQRIMKHTHFCLIQPMDEKTAVARHYAAWIECWPGRKKKITLEEEVRVLLLRGQEKVCDIYYKQYGGYFDNKGNPLNKKEYVGYLYDGGVEEALKGTIYNAWGSLFAQMAAADMQCNWNAMLAAIQDSRYIQVAEMLFRGRFYKLLTESTTQISYWNKRYGGCLDVDADTIEGVFQISDRQKINRIRDKNGGELMLLWMRFSEETEEKISDKVLSWLLEENLEPEDMETICQHMSVEQAMNYLIRQSKESYPGKRITRVLGQYEDYIRMCIRLKRKTSDPLIYKARELKRRHDELVEEIEVREAEISADEYSAKYTNAECVLHEIKKKFEYEGEEYRIKVPERIYEIVCEGRALHHCVGSTERYFDRIEQHETYICFLRKKAEPEKAFYTIEVEPGGTIRQHRGMYDEEPDLDTVKPFLREWQKEIKKRMSKEDHERAKQSKILREANIKELQERNNTRVLQGLLEDFMEAV